MKTKFGVYENAKVDAAFVETLAKIPSKETLIACLMSVIKGPIRGVAIALNAIAEKGNN
jgi:large subunit ribosomal protein L10